MKDQDFEAADADRSLLRRITEAGQTVRNARKNARISSRDFAKEAGINAGQVTDIEDGHIIPPSERVELFASILNLSEDGTRQLVATFEDAKVAKGLLRKMRESGIDLAPMEVGSSHIRVFRKTVIPELLQTRAYATSLFEHEYGAGGSDRKKAIDARIKRQEILFHSTKQIDFVIMESAFLPRRAFGKGVLAAQIDHIAKMQEHPKVAILFQKNIAHLGSMPIHAGFQIFDRKFVAVENSTGVKVCGENDVLEFEKYFQRFRQGALEGDRARDFLRKCKEYLSEGVLTPRKRFVNPKKLSSTPRL